MTLFRGENSDCQNDSISVHFPFNKELYIFCFVWGEDLGPSQQFLSHVGTFSLVEPVLT